MIVDPEGPLLVEGPVEVVLEDGTTVRSDRVVVAVCTCRRSGRYPWCDTSHRRRVRKGSGDAGSGGTGSSGRGCGGTGAGATGSGATGASGAAAPRG
ncbi:CDGSH iron-sulfur domain-containing protein [Streptomyces sparsogenes]|uniref:CDGSH iron-sulfur domain-containing protein n=1 Tax=Streptomyces sparsogenes TaxID=67365 RepID=UPI000A712C35|nr:CDGSH iron-sulfur domain-containing protein [Streptomyces sparsogenes]